METNSYPATSMESYTFPASSMETYTYPCGPTNFTATEYNYLVVSVIYACGKQQIYYEETVSSEGERKQAGFLMYLISFLMMFALCAA